MFDEGLSHDEPEALYFERRWSFFRTPLESAMYVFKRSCEKERSAIAFVSTSQISSAFLLNIIKKAPYMLVRSGMFQSFIKDM